jgi:hypothetical protein
VTYPQVRIPARFGLGMLVDRMNPSLLGSKKNGSRARKNAQACLIKSAIWHQGRELPPLRRQLSNFPGRPSGLGFKALGKLCA